MDGHHGDARRISVIVAVEVAEQRDLLQVVNEQAVAVALLAAVLDEVLQPAEQFLEVLLPRDILRGAVAVKVFLYARRVDDLTAERIGIGAVAPRDELRDELAEGV